MPPRPGVQFAGILAVAGVWAGCQCQPTIPIPPPDPQPDPPTGDTTPTGDTAPDPPCAVPEVEPNNGETTAVPLPLEKVGCGTISEPSTSTTTASSSTTTAGSGSS